MLPASAWGRNLPAEVVVMAATVGTMMGPKKTPAAKPTPTPRPAPTTTKVVLSLPEVGSAGGGLIGGGLAGVGLAEVRRKYLILFRKDASVAPLLTSI